MRIGPVEYVAHPLNLSNRVFIGFLSYTVGIELLPLGASPYPAAEWAVLSS